MKNKIFLLSFLLMSAGVSAQDIYQLGDFSATDLNGTARYVGLGGAMNSLGADLSTMSTNPAGTALYRHSDIAVTASIASQLDATGIYAEGRNKKGKTARKIKDVKKFVISFRIARNVTTSTGIRSIYLRITTPTGDVLSKGGTFQYENRNLEYSIRKDIEYTGEEQSIQVYWDVAETLSAGTYRVDIFADGHNIGTSSFSFEK